MLGSREAVSTHGAGHLYRPENPSGHTRRVILLLKKQYEQVCGKLVLEIYHPRHMAEVAESMIDAHRQNKPSVLQIG